MKKSLTFILPLALTLSGLAFIGTASAEETGTANVKINITPKPLLIKDRVGVSTTTKAREALKINAEKRDALRTATSSEKREAVKERADYRRTAVKEKVDAKRRAQIEQIAERTIKRLVAAVERLEKLSDRLESRLDKLSAGGVDVSKSKELLAEARAKIAEAKAKIDEAKAEIRSAMSVESPKEAFQKVREITGAANKKIKEAHKALVEVIRSANAKGGLNKKATSTAETTGTTTTSQ
ncbi:MAG: hypothetical protein AAB888_00340 [Patescibacteria group bacterium]